MIGAILERGNDYLHSMTREIQPIVSTVPAPIIGNIKQQPLTHPQYVAMKGYFRQHRDLLLCKCLFGTGLRIAEVLRWQPQQLRDDGVGLSVLVMRGKRRLKGGSVPVWEWMPLQGELSVELRAFVVGNAIGPTEPIFQVSARQVRNVFAEAGQKAIGRPVHPHELRHLFIKYQIDSGTPVEKVAELVGHADVRTTLKHYYDLDWEERRKLNDKVPV